MSPSSLNALRKLRADAYMYMMEPKTPKAWNVRPLTRLAELATVVGLPVAVIGLIIVLQARWPDEPARPPPSSSPATNNVAPVQRKTGLPSEREGRSPAPAAPAPVAEEHRGPGEASPQVYSQTPPIAPPPKVLPAPPSIRERAAFLLGPWRLTNEGCNDARMFRITGDVLEVTESTGNMIYSARIQTISDQTVRVSGSNPGQYTRNGRRLYYDSDGVGDEQFEYCG